MRNTAIFRFFSLIGVLSLFALVAVILPVGAVAQAGPTDCQYEDPDGSSGGSGGECDPVPPPEPPPDDDNGGGGGGGGGGDVPPSGEESVAGSELPFTGLDALALAAVAAALMLTGVALRRLGDSTS